MLHYLKKQLTVSNILFAILLSLILIKPTRAWLIRQISFAPTIEEVSESEKLNNYNVSFHGLNTEDVNLSNYKGKVIFLNYWATWCPPCVAELPMIQKLYNDYKENVAFVLVTSENNEKIKDFYTEHGYNLPTYNLTSELPTILNKGNSLPTTYLIDKKGFVRVYKTGAADWNSEKFKKSLDDILNE